MAILKNTKENYYQGCRVENCPIHCICKCKLVQPIWKSIWRFPKKNKNGTAI
jgi:hypothetical protein